MAVEGQNCIYCYAWSQTQWPGHVLNSHNAAGTNRGHVTKAQTNEVRHSSPVLRLKGQQKCYVSAMPVIRHISIYIVSLLYAPALRGESY